MVRLPRNDEDIKDLEEQLLKNIDKISDEVLEDVFGREEASCVKNRVSIYMDTEDYTSYVLRRQMGECVNCPKYDSKLWISYCVVEK